jgi:putative PIN family toxin of toxin-antitoxin system
VPPRKIRVPVVLDTNVIVGFFLSKTRQSANARVFDSWLITHRLQLIVSAPIIAEYLELLERVGIEIGRIESFKLRMQAGTTVTRVNLGKRFMFSRDPDDNTLLDTAHTGRARYLVTNDRDLLEIPSKERRGFRFEIVRPAELLHLLEL